MSLLRASLLGGVDGVITSFAIVAGASAGELASATLVVVVGTSSVLADGLSMGISEFLSSAGERALLKDASARPLRQGLACFAAFVLCGAVPLLAYLASESLLSCAMFSLVALMLLGAGRALASGEPLLLGLAQTATLGAAAGGVAYAAGRVAANAVG